MGNTKIDWCTKVWNPVTGCTPVSAGCANCYAKRQIKRFPALHGYEEPDYFGEGGDDVLDFGRVVCHSDRLDEPLHWRKPQVVFVCSMGDLFHDDVPDDFIGRVFGVMGIAERHKFIVLTKRPGQMRDWISSRPRDDAKPDQAVVPCEFGDLSYSLPWPPPNVWLGVSVEDQESADARIPLLLQTPAAKHIVSVEPMIGSVDLWSINDGSWHDREGSTRYNALTGAAWWGCTGDHGLGCGPRLDWVICGGESGPGARPMHPDWTRSLRDQCRDAGVPFWFKQWGEWAPRPNGDWKEINRHWFDTPSETEGTSVWRVGKRAASDLLDGERIKERP